MNSITQILLIFVFTFTTVLANDLTKEQQQEFLYSIDSVCGDVWCSGDNVFKFNSIDCEFENENCLVNYKVNDYEEGICEIVNIREFNDLKSSVYPIHGYVMCDFHKCFDQYTHTDSINLAECKKMVLEDKKLFVLE